MTTTNNSDITKNKNSNQKNNKIKIMAKLTLGKKLKISNCGEKKSNCDKTQKHKLSQIKNICVTI